MVSRQRQIWAGCLPWGYASGNHPPLFAQKNTRYTYTLRG